jgi:hypothetical protein
LQGNEEFYTQEVFCPTSELKLKLIPRGSYIFQKEKKKICIRRFFPKKNPKTEGYHKSKEPANTSMDLENNHVQKIAIEISTASDTHYG